MDRSRTFLVAALAAAILLPAHLDAQARGPGGAGMPMMMSSDPVAVALEHADALRLDAAQRAELEAFRAASLERSGEARRQVEEARDRMRERMEARRETMRERAPGERGEWSRGERGPRERMRGERPRPARGQLSREMRSGDTELRDAMRTVREEGRAGMAVLRETLTEEQRSELRGLLRESRPLRSGGEHGAHP